MLKPHELIDYLTHLFSRMGCPYDHANCVARVLTEAELRGIPSHGALRVKDYFQMIQAERINVHPNVKVVYQTPSTATIDGDTCLGPVAAQAAMDLAVEKARSAGTGWVAVRGSNHFGIAGYWAMQALEHEMIGFAITNANPLVAPVYSTSRMLGTNPIATAIPAKRNAPVVMDFATTPVARGKLALMAKQGMEAPKGLVQDAMGQPTTDPSTLERGGAIVPLGGDIEHGAHKGFCLSAIVDIMSSVLGGACFGPFVPPQVPYLPIQKSEEGKGMGHLFGAIRIDAFRSADDFKNAMDGWIDTFRSAKGVEGSPGVTIPGEPERMRRELKMKEGITLLDSVIKDLNEVADTLGAERLSL